MYEECFDHSGSSTSKCRLHTSHPLDTHLLIGPEKISVELAKLHLASETSNSGNISR